MRSPFRTSLPLWRDWLIVSLHLYARILVLLVATWPLWSPFARPPLMPLDCESGWPDPLFDEPDEGAVALPPLRCLPMARPRRAPAGLPEVVH
ncbi:hypothetical protein [Roseateles amylovorans]|uniref:DUF2946 domain-containing protein n=1 Tax=Roseateles amylovorans TaxID=2978473 RepID=A0ABY6AVL2_9BURK|nr:hypothetical protein [Roseateles amylovorans]UXH77231.1 hypothetical protein N4261_19770 [Roseateles amylovorans]